MSDWKVQSIQIVWFVQEPQALNASEVFKQSFDTSPDQTQVNRNVTPNAPFFSLAASVLNDRALRALVQPTRVDLHVQAPDALEGPSISSLSFDVHEYISSVLERISVESPVKQDATRLACVLNVIKEFPNLDDASRTINESIGGAVKFPGFSDLLMQVNRRKNFLYDPMIFMNRLLRFNSTMLHHVAVPLPLQGVLQDLSNFPSMSPPRYASNLMIDTNNVPGSHRIKASDHGIVLKELYDEASRIRDIGSIKALDD